MTLEEKNRILVEDNERLRKQLETYQRLEESLKQKMDASEELIGEYKDLISELRCLLKDAKRDITPLVRDTRSQLLKIRKAARKTAKRNGE